MRVLVENGVGLCVGRTIGEEVGANDGFSVGPLDGCSVGFSDGRVVVGFLDGRLVEGATDGCARGLNVGLEVDGAADGLISGDVEGAVDGVVVTGTLTVHKHNPRSAELHGTVPLRNTCESVDVQDPTAAFNADEVLPRVVKPAMQLAARSI